MEGELFCPRYLSACEGLDSGGILGMRQKPKTAFVLKSQNCPCHCAQKTGGPRNHILILEPHSPPEILHFLLLLSNPGDFPVCLVLQPARRATFPESLYTTRPISRSTLSSLSLKCEKGTRYSPVHFSLHCLQVPSAPVRESP